MRLNAIRVLLADTIDVSSLGHADIVGIERVGAELVRLTERLRVCVVLTLTSGAEKQVFLQPPSTWVERGMFVGRTDIAAAKIPKGVTSIEREAFRGCTSLASMKIVYATSLPSERPEARSRSPRV